MHDGDGNAAHHGIRVVQGLAVHLYPTEAGNDVSTEPISFPTDPADLAFAREMVRRVRAAGYHVTVGDALIVLDGVYRNPPDPLLSEISGALLSDYADG